MNYNYENLMAQKPTSLGTMKNSKGQTIHFLEHPTKGDESFIICVSHELKLAQDSTFFETDDMLSDHREYEPSFHFGRLFIGGYDA